MWVWNWISINLQWLCDHVGFSDEMNVWECVCVCTMSCLRSCVCVFGGCWNSVFAGRFRKLILCRNPIALWWLLYERRHSLTVVSFRSNEKWFISIIGICLFPTHTHTHTRQSAMMFQMFSFRLIPIIHMYAGEYLIPKCVCYSSCIIIFALVNIYVHRFQLLSHSGLRLLGAVFYEFSIF